MRVLHLGERWVGDQPGGLSRYVSELVQAEIDEGAEVEAVVLGPAVGAPAWARPGSRLDAPLPSKVLAFALAAWDGSAKHPDVVDAHFALYSSLPLAVNRALRKRPLVVHFHGPYADEAALEGAARKVVVTKRALERFVYRRADVVVALSEAFAERPARDYGVPRDRIRVIPPGVDAARFSPLDEAGRLAARRRLGLPTEGPLVVVVRRLVPRMGIEVLFGAWPAVRAAHPNATLAIVGEGSARATLEVAAPPGARFLGAVDDATLVDAYCAADVSVVPSHALEGFGLVVLESLACGTPVIGSDVDGLRDALGPFDRSLLVRPGDPKALGDLLVRVLEVKPEEAVARRALARAHAERHAWPKIAQAHLDLYRELLARG